ncbi:MAG: GNAT family N-acetyltransferase [Breznakibacter sp.]
MINFERSRSYNKYGIIAKLVDVDDAQIILNIRTNERRNQHVSAVSGLLDDQINWIQAYKKREEESKEFYFLIGDSTGWYGTTRIYNFSEDKFETGSWIFAEEAPDGMAVKGDIIGREYAFEYLGFKICEFEVRKLNTKVIRYHKSYKPVLVGEDELNYYFELNKDNFYKHSRNLLKVFGYGDE